MESGFEQLISVFTIKAQKLFAFTYEKFRFSTRMLDRQKDENVFQMQLGKYLRTLKLQLESLASEMMTRTTSKKNMDQCNKLLKDKIDIYVREFRQKAKLL